jgi:GTP-binding protein
MVKDRLDRELIGNVSLKVVDIGRPDAWEVQGRGELALAILVENMRREGFELTVGKPQVVTKRGEDGKVKEPFEHLTIDAPEEHLGAITQLMAARKGRMDTMTNHGTGWVRMEFVVPSRGLIGFRSEFLTITRGTGIANAISHGYDDWAGQITTRQNGSIVADRQGVVTPFAMIALQERMSSSCSRPKRSTRAWSSARTRAPTTWTSTSRRRRSSRTCARRRPTPSSR